ncbi:IS110 family transposase [Salinibacter ruber]|uniref:IS110 family transposase n=1 Tax=Salinibacter ruber TaxID=146919 RepID=UPI003C6E81AC
MLYIEIGDIDRFDSIEKLVACAGPDLQVEQSGDQVSKKGISKRGNRYIRSVLYGCVPIRMRDCYNPRWEESPCRTTLRSVEGKGKAPEGPEVACMLWARGDRLRLLVQRRTVCPPARSG